MSIVWHAQTPRRVQEEYIEFNWIESLSLDLGYIWIYPINNFFYLFNLFSEDSAINVFLFLFELWSRFSLTPYKVHSVQSLSLCLSHVDWSADLDDFNRSPTLFETTHSRANGCLPSENVHREIWDLFVHKASSKPQPQICTGFILQVLRGKNLHSVLDNL